MKYILLLSAASLFISHYTNASDPNDIKKFEQYIKKYDPTKNNEQFSFNMEINKEDDFPSINDEKIKNQVKTLIDLSLLKDYLREAPLNKNQTTNNITIASALLSQARIIDLLDTMVKLLLKLEYYQTTYNIVNPIIQLKFIQETEQYNLDPSILLTKDPQTYAIALQLASQISAIKVPPPTISKETMNAIKNSWKQTSIIIAACERDIKKESLSDDSKKYLANQIIALIQLHLVDLYRLKVPYFFLMNFFILLNTKQYQALNDVQAFPYAYLHLKNDKGSVLDIIPHGRKTIMVLCQLLQRYLQDTAEQKLIIIIDQEFKQIMNDIEILIEEIEPFKPLYNALYEKIIKKTDRFFKPSIITAMYDTLEQTPTPPIKSVMLNPPLYAIKTSQTTSYQPQPSSELQEYIQKQEQEKKKVKITPAKKPQTAPKPIAKTEIEQKTTKQSDIVPTEPTQFDITTQTPICYHDRIRIWFNNTFREKQSPFSNLYHSYPIIADYYIKAFGIHTTYHSPTRKKDIDNSYILAGEIEYHDDILNKKIKKHVMYVITFDPKGICYHRGFSTKDFELIKKYYEHIDFAKEKNKTILTPLKELIKKEITEISPVTEIVCSIEKIYDTGKVIHEDDFHVIIEDILNNAVITLYKPYGI